jgi:hypothetical protein
MQDIAPDEVVAATRRALAAVATMPRALPSA